MSLTARAKIDCRHAFLEILREIDMGIKKGHDFAGSAQREQTARITKDGIGLKNRHALTSK